MITLPLNKYYFISTVITTTNQSYHIKHKLHIYSTIIAILRFGFNDFIGLKKYAGSRWTTWPNAEFRTQLLKKNPGLIRLSLQRTTRDWASEKGP